MTPTFLFALLLYGPFAEIIEKQPQEKWHDIGTIVDAVDRAARQAQGRITIPKRFTLGVREMFAAQRGLGYLLMNAIGLYNVDVIMSVTFLLIVFASVVNGILLAIDHRLHHGA